MPDILAFFLWWISTTLVGWVAWPLAARFLSRLPDRGYTLSKAFGLLVGGYILWILSSLDYLRVNVGGIFIAFVILASASWLATRGDGWVNLRDWLRKNLAVVLAAESVFLIAFGVWAYVRALNPEITATEKPMEFAFLNSIIRTETMPPRDPWLSGFAISYYYFGYVIIGALTRISGVLPSVAFNLGIALLFGLTALGSFGVVLNMVASSRAENEERGNDGISRSIGPALLGPLFVLVTGNLTGFLEVLFARGIGTGRFWTWLNLRDLDSTPIATESGLPERFLWWWRASRVIRDVDLNNIPIGLEPIDEFPFFSFLLGDMHPHVLALPFVFVAIAVALHLYLDQRTKKPLTDSSGKGLFGGWLSMPVVPLLLYALILGGLSFLNTWDFPIYTFVLVAAYAAGRGTRLNWERRVWIDAGVLGLALAVLGVLLYLPFYISFASQASGILPNPLYPTRLNQFTVMFGTALVPLIIWLLWLFSQRRKEIRWSAALLSGPGILGSLMLLCGLLTLAIAVSDLGPAQQAVRLVLGELPIGAAVPVILRLRFITAPWVSLLLVGMLAIAGGMLFQRKIIKQGTKSSSSGTTNFALILMGTGALLTLGPEYVYLRDTFGLRMNTIFKFYYQAWVLWGVVAAFATWQVVRYASKYWKPLQGVLAGLIIAAGLVYPTLALRTKTEEFAGTTLLPGGERIATLDGMAYMQNSRAEDYNAIRWLNVHPELDGVIAEAIGGSYTEYARVSAHTGLQTVLGWPGHELQWRGGFDEAGGREDAIQTLYNSTRWEEARIILDEYDIEYVYVGPLERGQFSETGLAKFSENMLPVYDRDGVTVFARIDRQDNG